MKLPPPNCCAFKYNRRVLHLLKKIAIWIAATYACLLIFDEVFVRVFSQTPQQALTVVVYSNITSAARLDGCDPTPNPCIDNRSSFTRQSSTSSFRAFGTGSWSVTMQYADGSSSGPWTSFGSTAIVTQAGPSSGIGYGIGPGNTFKPYHDYIRFVITGSATIMNYSGTRQFWWLPSVATIAFPITADQGGTSGLFYPDVFANTLSAACTAASGFGEMLYLSEPWAVATGFTCAAPIINGGGVITPASGQTVVLNIQSSPANAPVCILSSGGSCTITSFSGEVYPYYWGGICVGSGGSDVTVALNAASASAIATGSVLRLTGLCKISGTGWIINAANKTPLIRGIGPQTSGLIWGGGTNPGITNAAMTISASFRGDYRDFGIFTDGTHRLDFGIVAQSCSGCLQTGNHMENVWISDQSNSGILNFGVYEHVGNADFQNDTWSYTKDQVSNYAGNAFLREGFENLNADFRDITTYASTNSGTLGQCAVSNGPTTVASGTYGLGYGGNFFWKGGFFESDSVANLCLGAQSGGVSTIEKFRSENSLRLLTTSVALTRGSAEPVPVHLADFDFSTQNGKFAMDGFAIIMGSGCKLTIDGTSYLGIAGTSVPVALDLAGNCETTSNGNIISGLTVVGSNTTVAQVFPTNQPYFGIGVIGDGGDTAANNKAFNILPGSGGTSACSTCAFFGPGAGSGDTRSNESGFGFGAIANVSSGSGSNTGVGSEAGQFVLGGSTPATAIAFGTFLGAATFPKNANDQNETLVGYFAPGCGSNCMSIGNASVTDYFFGGSNINFHLPLATGTGGYNVCWYNSGASAGTLYVKSGGC